MILGEPHRWLTFAFDIDLLFNYIFLNNREQHMDWDWYQVPLTYSNQMVAFMRPLTLVVHLFLRWELMIETDSFLTREKYEKGIEVQVSFQLIRLTSPVTVIGDQGLQSQRARAPLDKEFPLLPEKVMHQILWFTLIHTTNQILLQITRMLSSL